MSRESVYSRWIVQLVNNGTSCHFPDLRRPPSCKAPGRFPTSPEDSSKCCHLHRTMYDNIICVRSCIVFTDIQLKLSLQCSSWIFMMYILYVYIYLLYMYGYSMLLRHAASFGSGRMCGVSHLTASAECSLLSLVLYPNHPSLCDLQASVCMLRTLPWWQKSFLPKPHRCGTSLNPAVSMVWCYEKNARMILNVCSCAVWQLEGWPTCPVPSLKSFVFSNLAKGRVITESLDHCGKVSSMRKGAQSGKMSQDVASVPNFCQTSSPKIVEALQEFWKLGIIDATIVGE